MGSIDEKRLQLLFHVVKVKVQYFGHVKRKRHESESESLEKNGTKEKHT